MNSYKVLHAVSVIYIFVSLLEKYRGADKKHFLLMAIVFAILALGYKDDKK